MADKARPRPRGMRPDPWLPPRTEHAPPLAQPADQAALTQTLLKRAEAAPRGSFPRPFHCEQAYWTVIGEPDSTHAALLSEDGLLEPWPGGPALEPFLHLDGRRLGWAEVRTEQRLEDGDLPLPTTTWRADTLRLEVSAVATRETEHPLLLARYRVINAGETEQAARLELALRPLQVYPPWLQLAVAGGASPIHRLALTEDALLVNDEHRILALSPPTAIETTTPPPAPQLREPPKRDATPAVLVAENGLAGATWHYALSLAPGEQRDIILAIPFAGAPDPAVLRSGDPAELFERHLARQRECWRLQLDRVTLSLPTPEGETLAKALRSSLAYMLIHSPRPLIRPGSRGYARAWMRDGALMAHAFLQLGHDARARAFLRWYAGFQQPDGDIPCCVDDLGPDPHPGARQPRRVHLPARRGRPPHRGRRPGTRAVARRPARGRASHRPARPAPHTRVRHPRAASLPRPAARIRQPRGLPAESGALLLGRLLRPARPAGCRLARRAPGRCGRRRTL